MLENPPDGYHTLTPQTIVEDAPATIDFLADVFGAEVKAVEHGATPLREPADQFYGDRTGGVLDSQGNQWWISTHIEDVSEEEIRRRMAETSG